MNAVLADILNVVIKKIETSNSISVEIVSYKQDSNFLYLKPLNNLYDSELIPNDKVELQLIRHDGVYYFDSSIVKIDSISGNICIYSPKKCKKMDRRKFSRHKFETELKIKGAENDKYGVTFDLSEGGLGFYSKDFFYTDDILFIDFYSNAERKKYHVEVTVKDLFIGDDGYVKYGVEFADWVEDDFKQLTKYLQKKEARRLKNANNQVETVNNPEEKFSFFNKLLFNKK